MKEDFIQYVWKYGLFNKLNLKTVSGKSVEIIKVGFQNTISGPDFTNSKLKIDGQVWAGNVEIHLKAIEWNLHQHQKDEAYNNVILHVVYENSSAEILTQSNRRLETLVVKDLIFKETEEKYNALMTKSSSFVPCENLINIDDFLLLSYYDRLMIERLERKISDIEKDLELSQGDLDKAFLISLFKYFGAPQNKVPFEVLARSLDIKHIIKQAVSIESLEALLFGLAGFFDQEVSCSYKDKLENEFEYQKQLYKLNTTLKYSNWKFGGVRPPNFPSIRIAQLASLLFVEQRWFSYVQNELDSNVLKQKFKSSVSAYWKTHYNFGLESKESNKSISDAFFDKIMINVLVPFLFYYGSFVQDESYKDRAFEILLSLKPESNAILKAWKKVGFSNKNALESQALLELKNNYCSKKKCLDCRIGYKILNN